MMLQFAGDEVGKLRLMPIDGGEDIELVAEPGTVLILITGRYEYRYEPGKGKSMALSTFLLNEPASYSLEHITGDSQMILSASGPMAPKGDHISIAGMYCRYGTAADGR